MEKHECLVFKRKVCGITQKYSGSHQGIDLVPLDDDGNSTIHNADITAHSAGMVLEAVDGIGDGDTKNAYGNHVIIKHDGGFRTLYAHMKKGSVCVEKGKMVEKEQIIGYMGNTGKSQGAHLHFEVRNGINAKVDPTPYINAKLPGEKTDIEYVVQKGNSYWGIANMAKKTYGYKGTYKELQNYKDNPAHIHPGDIILIPVSTQTTKDIHEGSIVTVKKGAKTVNGVYLADWCYKDTFTVLADPENGKAKIGKIKLGIKRKTATMFVDDLEVVK